MSKIGFEVNLISPNKPNKSKGINHIQSVQVKLPKLDYLSHLIFLVCNLYTDNFDKFITFKFFGAVVGALISLAGINTEVTWFVRNDFIKGKKTRDSLITTFFEDQIVRLESFALKNIDKSVFVSRSLKKDILERSKMDEMENSCVLYNNVYTRRVKSMIKEKIDLNGQPTIGFVGRIRKDGGKGTKYLVDAARILRNRYGNIKIYLVGDGAGRRQLEKYCIRKNISRSVVFTGWKKNPIKYIRGFDVLVLPSIHEALGNCLLEALAVGTPVIASNVGGIPEIINQDKYLFEPKCPKCISKKIIKILSPENYTKAIKYVNARSEVFDFSWTSKAVGMISNKRDVECESFPPNTLSPRDGTGMNYS